MMRHLLEYSLLITAALAATACTAPNNFEANGSSQQNFSGGYYYQAQGQYNGGAYPYNVPPQGYDQNIYYGGHQDLGPYSQQNYNAQNNAHNRAYLHYSPQAQYQAQAYYGAGSQASRQPQYADPRTRRHQSGQSRGINLNYETLTAFEAPLAVDVAGATLLLRGRLDAPLVYSFENKGNVDATLVANHQISLEKQLPNRWTVGAVYAGRAYEDDGVAYGDQGAAFVGGSWGTVFGGNVSDLVYEATRRRRGATNEQLAGDGSLGELAQSSGGYRGRYGPVIVSGVFDEDDNYDLGVSFQRPIGNKDYRLTARHNNGRFIAADGLTEVDTKSVSTVAEYVYGSTRYDIGAGYEKLSVIDSDVDRWFTSAGFSTKQGVWSLSAEGHYGEIDGQTEKSALLGVRRDIARGLAVTAALNYEDRQISTGGVNLLEGRDTKAIMGLSYGF